MKTLNVSLTNQLLEAVFNDASKYRQAIDSEYITMDTFLVLPIKCFSISPTAPYTMY